jgi:hypothetical protein
VRTKSQQTPARGRKINGNRISEREKQTKAQRLASSDQPNTGSGTETRGRETVSKNIFNGPDRRALAEVNQKHRQQN